MRQSRKERRNERLKERLDKRSYDKAHPKPINGATLLSGVAVAYESIASAIVALGEGVRMATSYHTAAHTHSIPSELLGKSITVTYEGVTVSGSYDTTADKSKDIDDDIASDLGVMSKERYPVIILEGRANSRHAAAMMLRNDYNFKYVAMRPDTVRTLEEYIALVMKAVTDWSLVSPVVIDGLWLSDQLIWFANGEEDALPLVGRILDRLCERYAVGRAFVTRWPEVVDPDGGEENEREASLVRAFYSVQNHPDDIPDTTTGHRTYVSYLLATGLQRHNQNRWLKVDNDHDLFQACKETAREIARRPAWAYEEATSWYGATTPKVVFVGDKFNPSGMRWPFPFARTMASSAYLNLAINMAGYSEKDVAYVDINDEGGEEAVLRFMRIGTVRSHVQAAYPPIFIVLGEEAAKTFYTFWPGDAEIREIPHPSYVRRFHHGKLAEYVDLIAPYVGWDPRSKMMKDLLDEERREMGASGFIAGLTVPSVYSGLYMSRMDDEITVRPEIRGKYKTLARPASDYAITGRVEYVPVPDNPSALDLRFITNIGTGD